MIPNSYHMKEDWSTLIIGLWSLGRDVTERTYCKCLECIKDGLLSVLTACSPSVIIAYSNERSLCQDCEKEMPLGCETPLFLWTSHWQMEQSRPVYNWLNNCQRVQEWYWKNKKCIDRLLYRLTVRQAVGLTTPDSLARCGRTWYVPAVYETIERRRLKFVNNVLDIPYLTCGFPLWF